MTFATLLPYLLVVAGYLIRHLNVLSKLGSLVGIAAGPNPLSPSPTLPSKLPPILPGGNHPILSDAVNAAIQQATADAVGGHIASLKAELLAITEAAAQKAMSDLKAKI